MIKYIAHLMNIDDSLNIPGENTLGITSENGDLRVLTFENGKAEVPEDLVAFVKTFFPGRIFIKEEVEMLPEKEIEKLPISVESNFLESPPPEENIESEKAPIVKPAVIKNASSLRPKRRAIKRGKK